MVMRRLLIFFSILFVSLLAFHLLTAASELVVEMTTDKGEYQPGETVTITAKITLDGQPVSALIDRAYIEFSYGGLARRNYITWDFTQVGPGVYVAQGSAGRPGERTVYVTAHVTIHEGPCCSTVCGSGSAAYTVIQACQPSPSCCYQPCYPCYQPCQPCLECRAPDFFIKHVINPADVTEKKKISLTIPDHIMDQLVQMANPVTFREAPPHSVIWSDIPGMGWTNEALSDLGLSLDQRTGKISGYLIAPGNVFESHFFFIEALNPEGEVIAGIWIEIAFV